MGLSLIFVLVGSLIMILSRDVVFVFFGRRPIAFWTLEIDFPSLGR